MNIPAYVEAAVRRSPGKVALLDERRQWTYATLWERVRRLSSGLRGRGVQKGDKIAVLMGNCLEYVETYIALMRIGAVVVPVNHWMVGREIEVLMSHARPTGLILEQQFRERIDHIREPYGLAPDKLVVLGDETPGAAIPYAALLENTPADDTGPPVRETDYYGIYYTSGTTGTPKGALRDHQSMTNCALVFGLAFGLNETDRYLVSGPLFHFSHSMIANLMLMLGGTAFVLREFKPQRVIELIARHRISVSFMVPTMWNDLLGVPGKEQVDVRSLRIAISSGAPLLTPTKQGILEYFTGVQLFESYGWSELNFLTVLRPEDQLRKERCVGKPMPGAWLKIVDEAGTEVGPNEVGVIYGRCPGGFIGYYENAEANEATTAGEWRTGNDMGRKDDEGYLYIVDRQSDMIISGGENIFPREIEEVIASHPNVESVAVIGVPDARWGEAVKAVILLRPGAVADEREIISYCAGKLASFKRPKSVDFVDAMPKNSMGKILKKELRQRYWLGRTVQI